MNTPNRDSCTHHFEHVKQTRPFTERDGSAIKWKPIPGRTGGILGDKHFPPGLSQVGTTSLYDIPVWPFTVYRSLCPKTPRTRVYQTRHKYWRFDCNKCPQGAESPDWNLIQKLATNHAHNHHGR